MELIKVVELFKWLDLGVVDVFEALDGGKITCTLWWCHLASWAGFSVGRTKKTLVEIDDVNTDNN